MKNMWCFIRTFKDALQLNQSHWWWQAIGLASYLHIYVILKPCIIFLKPPNYAIVLCCLHIFDENEKIKISLSVFW